MALDLKQLEDKPWYFGAGIGAALAAVIVAAGYYGWPNFDQMKGSIVAKTRQSADLQQKIDQGRAAERRLPQLREESRLKELELQRLLLVLPTKRNTEELIKRIEALARQGDFILKRFSPKEFVNKDFYAEWPIDINVEGTYHNLALFFDKVARFSRIINVETLQVTGNAVPRSGRTLAANFQAKTFIYLGDKEEPKPAPAKGGKKK